MASTINYQKKVQCCSQPTDRKVKTPANDGKHQAQFSSININFAKYIINLDAANYTERGLNQEPSPYLGKIFSNSAMSFVTQEAFSLLFPIKLKLKTPADLEQCALYQHNINGIAGVSFPSRFQAQGLCMQLLMMTFANY